MNNIDRIRQLMPKYKCSAVLITNPVNRLFATGFSSSYGALIITGEKAWFIVDSRYIEAAQAAVKDAQVMLPGKKETLNDSIKSILINNKVKSVGFEDGTVSYSTYMEWTEKFNAKLIPVQKLINGLRSYKSRSDIDCLIKAQRLSEDTFKQVLTKISTDMTEKDLAAELIYHSLKNGADDISFNPIVLSGSNASRPHGVPGNGKIGNGFLTIDYGVKLNGWCSDTTRTLCIGKPDDEMIKVYDTVLKAQEAGIAAIHGGVKGYDVDKTARNIIEEAGYGEFFGHGFGHSQGLEVHETLRASPLSTDILPAGTVLSAEPGIYLPGKYGVRIEDTIYVTESGCENITQLPKILTVL